jgi:hypothetical protein
MGGANTGRSNKDKEANPPEELCRTTPTTNIETTSSPNTTQGLRAHSTEILRGRRPDIQLLYHAR